MRWFKRGCWISAWGVWLWLGFGLYRELPRQLGGLVCKLPIQAGDGRTVFGFVGDTNNVLLQIIGPQSSWSDERMHFLLFDAESAKQLGERSFLAASSILQGERTRVAALKRMLRHGVLIGRPITGPAIQVLDVMNNEWRPLSKRRISYLVPHPVKPWVAVVEGKAPGYAERCAVVDLRTGKDVFSHPFHRKEWISHPPFFIADQNALVFSLLVAPTKGAASPKNVMEVWTLDYPHTLEETIDVAYTLTSPYSLSHNGRLLFHGMFNPTEASQSVWVDVYDFNERKFLSSLPRSEQPSKDGDGLGRTAAPRTAVIEAGGSTVLRYGSRMNIPRGPGQVVMDPEISALYEVGAGRVLWRAAAHEQVTAADVDDGFVVTEQWQELWKQWLPDLKYETKTRRSLQNGRFLERTPGSIEVAPIRCNKSRTLVVMPDGSVHRLPLKPNWPLLAFCQLILASPLILLWAGLQRRRKRRLRLGAL